MEITNLPVKFTAKAEVRLHELAENIGLQAGQGLRIGSRGGGCGPQAYFIAFDFMDANDSVYSHTAFEIFINKAQAMHVAGLTIDYEQHDNEQGFVFKNDYVLK